MRNKTVKELMVPLSEYAQVSEEANLLDAIEALEKSQKNKSAGVFPHRAVLVINKNGEIVGKLGHLGFLKALEPKYNKIGDMESLSRAGLSSEFISTIMENMRLWGDDMVDICSRAKTTKVKTVMRPVTENVQEDASLTEAIHKILMHQSLSIIVLRGDKPVGILRLSDIYAAITENIKGCAK